MKFLRNQRGQGMTEYIIIVALIAIAAIAAFSYFGKTVRDQTAAMSQSMAGDASAAAAATGAAKAAAQRSSEVADTDKNLQNYVED